MFRTKRKTGLVFVNLILAAVLLISGIGFSVPVYADEVNPERTVVVACSDYQYPNFNAYGVVGTGNDGGEKVIYWTPDGFGDLCVSLYLDNDTGIIKSSSIVFDCKKEQANAEFINIFQNTVTDNNKYIVTSEYETDKYYIIKFEDRRYREQSTLPTLKKRIDENDLY